MNDKKLCQVQATQTWDANSRRISGLWPFIVAHPIVTETISCLLTFSSEYALGSWPSRNSKMGALSLVGKRIFKWVIQNSARSKRHNLRCKFMQNLELVAVHRDTAHGDWKKSLFADVFERTCSRFLPSRNTGSIIPVGVQDEAMRFLLIFFTVYEPRLCVSSRAEASGRLTPTFSWFAGRAGLPAKRLFRTSDKSNFFSTLEQTLKY